MSATSLPFLRQLGPQDADELLRRVRRRRFAKAQPILRAGAAGDDVVVVLSGRVRLVAIGAEHREVVLAIRGEGELLGEMAALGAQRRTASAIALDDVDAGNPPRRRVPRFPARPPGRRTRADQDAGAAAVGVEPRSGGAGHAGQRRPCGQAPARSGRRSRRAVGARDADRAIAYAGRARALDRGDAGDRVAGASAYAAAGLGGHRPPHDHGARYRRPA